MFLAGTDPFSIAIADFNGDGVQDLAVANSEDDDVSVLLGTGNGRFRSQSRFPSGEVPVSVAVGDFNADGLSDLAVANERTDDVSVLLGRGDGSFLPQKRFSTGDSPGPVIVGDFNGDGKQDLVTADYLSHDISALLGRGDGSFGSPARFEAGESPIFVVSGDFNADGALDLAVADNFSPYPKNLGDVVVLLGRGDGTFGAGTRFQAGFGPIAVTTGDLNRDGVLDLAVANRNSHDVSVLLGRGDGTFLPQTRWRVANLPNLPFAGSPFHLAIGDLNQDAMPDLVVAELTLGENVSILPGRGDGTFAPSIRLIAGIDAVYVAVADLDGDGLQDLVVANLDSDDISVHLGIGGGLFASPPRFRAGRLPHDIALGDFNRDGIGDLVVANFGLLPGSFPLKSDISVLLGTGDGRFSPDRRFEVPFGPEALAIGDFNQDGIQDLAVEVSGGGVLLGAGDGTFGAFTLVGRSPLGSLRAIASADFDGDGREDLALARVREGGLSAPAEVSVWLGLGDGGFAFLAGFPVGITPFTVRVEDLDGDQAQDLVVVNESHFISLDASPPEHGDVSILIGRGNGTFEPERRYEAGRRPSDAAIADFDLDGILDLAVVNASSRDVSVRLGLGGGNFGPERRFGVGRFPRSIAAADFDANGFPDLAVANQGGSVSVLAGLGDGEFETEARFWAGSIPTALAVADFNRDGRPDVVTANAGSNDVTVLTAELRWECTSAAGARVLLDGSVLAGLGSAPDTSGGMVSFEWLENFGLPSEVRLGIGRVLDVVLPLGTHRVTLRWTDSTGTTQTREVVPIVEDTTPPALSVTTSPSLLWPPDHRLVEVEAAVEARDVCGSASVVLQSVLSDEPDDLLGEGDGSTLGDIQGVETGTFDSAFLLRAERSAREVGRTYRVTYRATDDAGNPSTAVSTILVPRGLDAEELRLLRP